MTTPMPILIDNLQLDKLALNFVPACLWNLQVALISILTVAITQSRKLLPPSPHDVPMSERVKARKYRLLAAHTQSSVLVKRNKFVRQVIPLIDPGDCTSRVSGPTGKGSEGVWIIPTHAPYYLLILCVAAL